MISRILLLLLWTLCLALALPSGGSYSRVTFSMYPKGSSQKTKLMQYTISHPSTSSPDIRGKLVREESAYSLRRREEKQRTSQIATNYGLLPRRESTLHKNSNDKMRDSRPKPLLSTLPKVHRQQFSLNPPQQLPQVQPLGGDEEILGINLAEALDDSVPIKYY